MPMPPTNVNVGFGWVVQSFSGESISTATPRILSDIIPRYLSQHRTAIVCSACVPVVPYSTSQLLFHAASKAHRHRRASKYRQSKEQDSKLVHSAEWFRFQYWKLTQELIRHPSLVKSMHMIINKECNGLCSLSMLTEDNDFDDLEDMLILTSERISSHLLSHVLIENGYQTEVIFAEEIEASVRQNVSEEDVMDRFLSALSTRLENSYPRMPIVTGIITFPEYDRSHRGGFAEPLSILLAISLQAIELQLWDAGNGVITADSHRVSSARVVRSISPAEAKEMAQLGQPCISSAVLDQVASKDISVKLGDPNDHDLRGTVIRTPMETFEEHPLLPTLKPTDPLRVSLSKPQILDRRPTAVVVKDSAFLVNITANASHNGFTFMGDVFRVLANHNVDPDIISSTPMHVAVVVDAEKYQGDVGVLADELGQYGVILVQFGISIITLVGDQMRHNAGISGHVVSTLTQGGIRVNMIGPGTGTSLSCAIGSKELTKAVRLLHHTLFRKLDRKTALLQ